MSILRCNFEFQPQSPLAERGLLLAIDRAVAEVDLTFNEAANVSVDEDEDDNGVNRLRTGRDRTAPMQDLLSVDEFEKIE
jgi:hypothetical protein